MNRLLLRELAAIFFGEGQSFVEHFVSCLAHLVRSAPVGQELTNRSPRRDEARMDAMQREAEASEDFKEATQSFIEKRKPVFQGR